MLIYETKNQGDIYVMKLGIGAFMPISPVFMYLHQCQ